MMKNYFEKIHCKIREIKISQLFLLFYMIAVLGWVWEFLLRYHLTGTIAKWGVLHGPWAPIYGVCGIMTVVMAGYLAKHPLWMFAGSMIICTTIEYVTSIVLEYCYGMRWWDYSSRAFNLQGRICLETTMFFGVVCMVLVYLVIPRLLRLLRNIPGRIRVWMLLGMTVIFAIDVVVSLWNPNMAGLL